ncbi:hypothetical protein ZWY2020_005336 [Hordeum vulgare]|nr:hypothetical protein ZWY2020_005336 [Hordeum vulgare]
MCGADRLSDLSEGLLQSIVSFLPAREAARASALSRQWRPLWLRTDSLNLDSRSCRKPGKDDSWHGRDGIQMNRRLFSDASKFLGAAGRCGRRIKKLSITVEGREDRQRQYLEDVMGNSRWGPSRARDSHDLMASLLAAPPLGHVEELRVRFEVMKNMGSDDKLSGWIYKLHPAVLPGHALRVLDLVFCRLESSPEDGGGNLSFPCLSELRLYRCSSSTQDLEGLVRAAPSLFSMHIQDHNFYCSGDSPSDRFALHSASLTNLTLVDNSGNTRLQGIELDTPCLRTFKYNILRLTELSMKSQATKLARADLTLQWTYGERGGEPVLPRFAQDIWKFLGLFRHAKAIRLKVPNICYIAVDEGAQHEHLVMLPDLERLELEGFADPGRRDNPDREDDAATAIANLLHCCPVIRDLRIRILTDPYQTSYAGKRSTVSSSDFDVSMDLFRKRFSKEMVPLLLDRDDDDSWRVAELPGLTGCRFGCLENHLKKLTLQFDSEDMNSFEVRLAKFFAKNCMVLDALQVEDGKQNFLSHVNWMVQRWRADAVDQRKHIGRGSTDSSGQSRKRKGDYGVEHKVENKRNYRKQMFASYT